MPGGHELTEGAAQRRGWAGAASGANVAVALKIAERLGPGKNVVTTIVDRRDRYLSEAPFEHYVV